MPVPLIIAHRGDSSSALENSLEAFRLALSVPADMIELDLRMSRDDVLYVMHDRETGRTADRNIDLEQSLSAQVDGIRLRNQEPIPRLGDALSLISGKAGVNIEIKSDGAGAVLSRHLSGLSGRGSLMVSSFREAEVQTVRTALPGLACALIFDAFSIRHLAEYRARGYTRISLRKNTVTEPLVRACHGQGVQVFVWTVDEEDEMKRCIEWEVDGIYTNKPRVLKQVLGKHS
jgi:glycerophosphoryl diester phosphodiesterase